jgi:ATP-dependent Clp protease ATP-binding subunit ClpX
MRKPVSKGILYVHEAVEKPADKPTENGGQDSATKSAPLYCSFCGKSQYEVRKLIAGPTVFICDECVELCMDIIHEEPKKAFVRSPDDVPTPREICDVLDDYVFGQFGAKRTLAVTARDHFQRVAMIKKNPGQPAPIKSNLLMIGPSGSGKSQLLEILRRLSDVAFSTVSAESLKLPDGGVRFMFEDLIEQANYDIAAAQTGVVIVDRLDDLLFGHSNAKQEDRLPIAFQQSMANILKGTTLRLPSSILQSRRGLPPTISTENILFICTGVFEGLDEVIRRRFRASSFERGIESTNQADAGAHSKLDSIDLINYGMTKELAAAFPQLAVLEALNEATLVDIMTRANDCLVKQYKEKFDRQGVELSFTEDALYKIARKAIAQGTGVWGLRRIFDDVLKDVLFELPNLRGVAEVAINADAIEFSDDAPDAGVASAARPRKDGADVFVSYKREERESVKKLARALESLKMDVWFDTKLQAGESFSEEINREIRRARSVVVCWSNASVESQWVRSEATIAHERGVLVPCFLEPCSPFAPFNLIHGEILSNMTLDGDNEAWRAIVARLGQLLERPGVLPFLDIGIDRRACADWLCAFPDDPLVDDVVSRLRRLSQQ